MTTQIKRVRVTRRFIRRCLLLGSIFGSLSALVGCNGYNSPNNPPPASAASSPSAAATAAGADSQASAPAAPSNDSSGASGGDAWQLGQEMSPMDGEIIQAQRTYQFANDSDMVAQVQFNCMVQKQQLVVKIGSYVGGTNHPTKASAYQTSFNQFTGSVVPNGRIRFGTFDPVAFADYFDVSSFANIAEMDVGSEGEIPVVMNNNGVVDLSLGGILGYYAKLEHISIDGRKLDQNPLKGVANGRNTYNEIAAFGYLFPIAVEIVNGRGTFDFIINKSDSINTVLDRCGANKPVIDPSLLLSNDQLAARAAEQAKQAAQNAAMQKWQSGDVKLDHLADLLGRYAADHPSPGAPNSEFGTYPASLQAPDFARYAAPSDLIDPYGHPFFYVREISGYQQSFQLTYYGADGIDGGTGIDRDCVFSGSAETWKDSCH